MRRLASSSHNGALVFGLVLGAAAGAAWAVWNATESGERLRAETRAMVDAALGRTHDATWPPLVLDDAGSGSVLPETVEAIELDGSRPADSPALAR
jgi:hypothetical protein